MRRPRTLNQPNFGPCQLGQINYTLRRRRQCTCLGASALTSSCSAERKAATAGKIWSAPPAAVHLVTALILLANHLLLRAPPPLINRSTCARRNQFTCRMLLARCRAPSSILFSVGDQLIWSASRVPGVSRLAADWNSLKVGRVVLDLFGQHSGGGGGWRTNCSFR